MSSLLNFFPLGREGIRKEALEEYLYLDVCVCVTVVWVGEWGFDGGMRFS